MNDMTQPKLFGVAHLNEKGQLVIPKEAREFLGIKSGDRVLITSAPFFKAIVIARPEDFEAQLQNMMTQTAETIGDMRKELKK